MSNGNDELPASDEFGAGISERFEREDAQAAFDAKLVEIDDEIDLLLSALTAPLQADIAAAQDASISVRADLGTALARDQLGIEQKADEIRGDLLGAADFAVDAIAVEAGALRDVVTAQTDIRPFEDAAVTGEPGVPLTSDPVTVEPDAPEGTHQIPGSGLDFALCSGSVEAFNAWIAFPGLGDVGPYTISAMTGQSAPATLPPQPWTQFSFLQTVWIDGPGCMVDGVTRTFTTVAQSTPIDEFGFFGPDACMFLPTCMYVPDPPLPDTPLDEPIPDDAEPPVTPLPIAGEPNGVLTGDCPVPPELVVAMDCAARILVVRRADEIADDDRFIVVGDARDQAQFGLDDLLVSCDTGTPPVVEPPTGPFLPDAGTPRPVRGPGCVLPPVVTRGPPLTADWLTDRQNASISASGLARLASTIPLMGNLPFDQVSQILLNTSLNAATKQVFDEWAGQTCPDVNPYRRAANERALLVILNGAVPGLFDEQIVAIDQEAKELCPKRVPTPADAVAAYRANTATFAQAMCWIKANGFAPAEYERVLGASRAMPNVNELIGMKRRGIITEGRFVQQAREAGWVIGDDVEHLLALSEQIPGPSDITRMMVRDAADDVNIDWTKSDASFVQKFTGPLKKWAEWQAIPTEAMKFQWRSHWEIPSATQLFTMMHRIGRNADGSPVPGFRDRVKRALEQNDLMPDWVDDVLDINFRLPRRADLRRVFRVGIFSEADLLGEFVKQGLESKTAEGLVKFEVREKKRAFANNPLVAKYARGEINADELFDELGELGADPDGLRTALKRGKLLMRMRRRNRCLEAIRHRVLIGEIDRNESEQLAMQQTADADQSLELAETWQCERDARSKSTTAAELCKWYKDFVIDAAQFMRQLRAIGFSRELAEAKFQACQNELNRKLGVAAERERKRAQREADKLAGEAKQQAAQSERQVASQLANLEQARKATNRREKQVTDAARTVANRTETTFDDALTTMMAFYRGQLRLSVIDADELASAVLSAAKIKSVTGLESWRMRVESIIDVVA